MKLLDRIADLIAELDAADREEGALSRVDWVALVAVPMVVGAALAAKLLGCSP